MSGSSILMQFRRILCLDLPFRPLMFQVMTFMVNSLLGGKRSSLRDCVSVRVDHVVIRFLYELLHRFFYLIFCSPLDFFSGLSLGLL
jgi:hypothetical protein